MMKRQLFRREVATFPVLLVILYLCGCGCDLEGSRVQPDRLVVMTYNVQNLFDPFVTGHEYPEYTPEEGWTAQRYRTRLERIANALTQGHGSVPDIMILQEIENAAVLEDLLRFHLGRYGFRWFAATGDRGSAIQTGMISRVPIIAARTHGVQGTRSILECTIESGGEDIVILALHAKSRIEGIEETEDLRLATSRAVSARADDLIAMNPFLPVIVAGDFNESADAILRDGASFTHALVPMDVPAAEIHGAAGALMLTGRVPPAGCWYSWWLDRGMMLLAASDGSYLHQGVWETFDQVLLSPAFFDAYGWEFQAGRVASFPPLCDGNGRPAAWDVRTDKGYSDHLPVSVELVRK
jgi:endonuclease/exonuclease/phosphatase family metal-dependent hydrolase